MKIKKILSLLIVFALAFSVMSIANVQAAGDEFGILRTLGINVDFSDDKTPMTRYQLAEVALQLTGDAPSSVGNPVFPDIPAKHKYFPVINVVSSKGLMGATLDGSFAPDSIASTMDGGRVLLAELGYTGFAQQAGWTDLQYMSKVKSLGLTTGIETSDGLTYNAFGKMIVNMLTKNVMEISSIDNKYGIQYTESNRSYVETKYGYVLKSGVLQAAGSVSMAGYGKLDSNKVTISGKRYVTTGEDYTKLVGREVKFILSSSNSDAKVILIQADTDSEFEEIVLSSDEITSVASSGSKYVVSYLDKNDMTDKISIKNTARIAVNGQNITDTSKISKYLKPDIGSVTFIDNNSDEIYDIVHVESVIYVKTGALSLKSISDQFTKKSFNIEDKDVFFYNDGSAVDYTSIEPGSYAELASGDIDFTTVNGNEIIVPNITKSDKISLNVINSKILKGTVSGLVGDKVIIDETTYGYNPYYYDLILSGYAKKLAINDIAEVALNENDEIIDIISTTSEYATGDNSKLKYGYMTKMSGVSELSEQAIIKYVDIEKLEEVIAYTSDDCTLNGKPFKFQDIANYNHSTAKTSATIYFADGSFKDQLIKYELNEKGQICKLYLAIDHANPTLIKKQTAHDPSNAESHPYGAQSTYVNPDYDPEYIGYDNNNFSLDFMGMSIGSGMTSNNLYEAVNNKTILIKIPESDADKKDLRNWRVYMNTRLEGESAPLGPLHYDVKNFIRPEFYDVSDKYEISVIIKRQSAGVQGFAQDSYSEQTRIGIVTDIMNTYDEETSEVKTQVTLSRSTSAGVEKITYIPKENDMKMSSATYKNFDGQIIGGNDIRLGSHAAKGAGGDTPFKWSDLKIGDVIQVHTNAAGQAIAFSLYVRYDMIEKDDYFGNILGSSGNTVASGPLAGKFLPHYYTTVDVGYVTDTYGIDGFVMNIDGPNGKVAGRQYIRELVKQTGGKNSALGGAMIHYAGTTKCEPADIDSVKVGDRVIVHRLIDGILDVYIIR